MYFKKYKLLKMSKFWNFFCYLLKTTEEWGFLSSIIEPEKDLIDTNEIFKSFKLKTNFTYNLETYPRWIKININNEDEALFDDKFLGDILICLYCKNSIFKTSNIDREDLNNINDHLIKFKLPYIFYEDGSKVIFCKLGDIITTS